MVDKAQVKELEKVILEYLHCVQSGSMNSLRVFATNRIAFAATHQLSCGKNRVTKKRRHDQLKENSLFQSRNH